MRAGRPPCSLRWRGAGPCGCASPARREAARRPPAARAAAAPSSTPCATPIRAGNGRPASSRLSARGHLGVPHGKITARKSRRTSCASAASSRSHGQLWQLASHSIGALRSTAPDPPIASDSCTHTALTSRRRSSSARSRASSLRRHPMRTPSHTIQRKARRHGTARTRSALLRRCPVSYRR